jgi:hypothetical protein
MVVKPGHTCQFCNPGDYRKIIERRNKVDHNFVLVFNITVLFLVVFCLLLVIQTKSWATAIFGLGAAAFLIPTLIVQKRTMRKRKQIYFFLDKNGRFHCEAGKPFINADNGRDLSSMPEGVYLVLEKGAYFRVLHSSSSQSGELIWYAEPGRWPGYASIMGSGQERASRGELMLTIEEALIFMNAYRQLFPNEQLESLPLGRNNIFDTVVEQCSQISWLQEQLDQIGDEKEEHIKIFHRLLNDLVALQVLVVAAKDRSQTPEVRRYNNVRVIREVLSEILIRAGIDEESSEDFTLQEAIKLLEEK